MVWLRSTAVAVLVRELMLGNEGVAFCVGCRWLANRKSAHRFVRQFVWISIVRGIRGVVKCDVISLIFGVSSIVVHERRNAVSPF